MLREKAGMLPERVLLLRRQPRDGRPLHDAHSLALDHFYLVPVPARAEKRG
jgi:hypothetical protein